MDPAQQLWSAIGYREFLRAWFDARKREHASISLAVLGKRLSMDPSLLGRILQGERHLATSRIQPVCDLVGLAGDAAEFFRLMVLHAKSKTAREAQVLFARMQELRRVAPLPLDDTQATYWDSWIHVALRSLLSCGDFADDWERMGGLLHPRQGASTVRRAMRTLADLGLVSKDAAGIWRLSEPFVKDGPRTQARALRNFHRQGLLLAMEAIESLPREQRHISSATVAVDAEEARELTLLIDDFRQRILARAARVGRADRVFQVGVQMVPLAGAHLRDAPESV